MTLFLIIATMTNLLFSYLNFGAFMKGYTPTLFQAYGSIICILFWFAIAFYYEGINNRTFSTITYFWITGFIIIPLTYWLNLIIVFLPASLIWASPFYGIRYFIKIPSNLNLALLCMLIPYGAAVLGLALRKALRHYSKK